MPRITSTPEVSKASHITTDGYPADWTLLHVAASQRYGTQLLTLMRSDDGSKITDFDQKDRLGMTPLLLAAQAGNLYGILFLLSVGANVRARDKDNWSALHHAAFSGSVDLIPMLLETRELLNSLANGSSTALHLAVANRQDAVVDLLVAAGSMLFLTDEYGRTPADIARKQGRKDLAKKLAP